MRRAAFLAWVSILVAIPALHAAETREIRARKLYESAVRRLERGTYDDRRLAVRDLEGASLLDTTNVTYPLLLARVLLSGQFLHESRVWAERVLRREPEQATAHALVGLTWRADWLTHVDDRSLGRAINHLFMSARKDPARCETWLVLTPLLVEQGELQAARVGAMRALEADSGSVEAMLSVAYTAYLGGELQRSRRWFEAAIPRLRPDARRCFEDIGGLLPPADRQELALLKGRKRVAYEGRFWKELDPNLVSEINEARLEFWSRAAHAYFLYFDPRRGGWDMRGDLYVRFGPPIWTERNPVSHPSGIVIPSGNYMVWGYPHLGMRIWMGAANPMGPYFMPFRPGMSREMLPFPDSLARRAELLATRGRRGVFPRHPPGVKPLEVRSAIARFEGESSPRLIAHAECVGTPSESLTVSWVAIDSTGLERLRGRSTMAASACAPGEVRAGGFAADLIPGRYDVGMTIQDPHGGLGVSRSRVELRSVTSKLSLSDVVVTCSGPEASILPGQGVRIEPSPEGLLSDPDLLTAYFEIYHLKPDAVGDSRFEYVYVVRSGERDTRVWLQRALSPRRLPAPIEASRTETTPASIRRQFVTVPIRTLPPGRYEIEIRVKDLVSGEEVSRAGAFIKNGHRRNVAEGAP